VAFGAGSAWLSITAATALVSTRAYAGPPPEPAAPISAAEPVPAEATAEPATAPAPEEPSDAPAGDPAADADPNTGSPDTADMPAAYEGAKVRGSVPLPQSGALTPITKLPPKHRIVYSNLLVARLNPLGVEDRLSIGYQYRLYDKPGKLFDGSYLGVSFDPVVSPAMTRIGPTLTVQPLAILRFTAHWGLLQHFGTFQFLQSYDSPYVNYSKFEQDANEANKYAPTGVQGQLGALFQVKFGPIAMRSDTNFFRNDVFGLRGDDDLWYDIRNDMLVAAHGWHMTNDSDLIYLSKFGLTAGIRASTVKAFYPEDVYEPGERIRDPNGPTFRVGPLLAYTFFDRPEKRFNRPTLLVIANWWVKHRYRTGSDEAIETGSIGDSVVGMPYIVIGFAFNGDLWGKDKK
jgi:hypothetical protein